MNLLYSEDNHYTENLNLMHKADQQCYSQVCLSGQ